MMAHVGAALLGLSVAAVAFESFISALVLFAIAVYLII